MANITSTEIGWIITNPHSDEYKGKLFEDMPEDENGCYVPGTDEHAEATRPEPLYVETHPHDTTRVFVSWCDPDHGWDDLTEPTALKDLVREHVAQHDPEAVVTWGVIQTSR